MGVTMGRNPIICITTEKPENSHDLDVFSDWEIAQEMGHVAAEGVSEIDDDSALTQVFGPDGFRVQTKGNILYPVVPPDTLRTLRTELHKVLQDRMITVRNKVQQMEKAMHDGHSNEVSGIASTLSTTMFHPFVPYIKMEGQYAMTIEKWLMEHEFTEDIYVVQIFEYRF